MAIRHFGMPAKQTSHWRRQIVRISTALLPAQLLVGHLLKLSPLNLMDDVLEFGRIIFLNLLLIAFWYGQCDAWLA